MVDVVVAEGSTPSGDRWTVRYRPEGLGGRHHLALTVDGLLQEEGAGLEVPETTEIGFCAGLKPGEGDYFLFGLVSSRVRTVRAEGQDGRHSDVATAVLPEAISNDGAPLRSFVIVRPPVDDVTALVGLDADGEVVQRIGFLAAP